VGAPERIATLPVIFVDVIEVTVTGIVVVPLVRTTVAYGWKFVPGIEVMVTVVPRAPLLGVNEPEIVGALLMTVNPLLLADLLSGLVTTTSHDPIVAPIRSNEQVIFDEDTTITLVPVMVSGGDPVRVNFTVAPGWKPVPARLEISTVQPRLPETGVMELTVNTGYTVIVLVAAVQVGLQELPGVSLTVNVPALVYV